MDTIRKEYKLIDLFCTLAQIPSPSLKEEKVASKIIDIFKENNVNANLDDFGNVWAKVEATNKNKKSILLSSHMDVVGDDSPINLKLNGDIIETDKSRTLGADDKVGVAAAIMLAIELANNKEIDHGGLEIIFTRDEEHHMSGIKHVKMENIEAEHVMVLDADRLGQVQIAGANYTSLIINVEGLKGGHSGIDIDDNSRLNAAKLAAEIANDIPQGVYKKDEYGVVTSINLGVIVGGGIDTAMNDLKEETTKPNDYIKYIIDKAVTNVINTKAGIVYSIRSSSREFESNLLNEITKIIDNFNTKYNGLAKATMQHSEHIPPFEKSDDETLINVAREVGKNLDIELDISSFHAGAETHIYANNTNKFGQKLKPTLVGLANIYNMHSVNEQVDYKTFLKGYDFLKEFFIVFNK